jgi:hypothetical protein
VNQSNWLQLSGLLDLATYPVGHGNPLYMMKIDRTRLMADVQIA